MLAAMCRSPRRELRRLSAQALASLTWNGHADSRAFGADIREQWRLWVDVAVNRAKHSLKLKHHSAKVVELAQVSNLRRDARSLAPRTETSKSIANASPRDVAVARRQWALRHRRTCEGPNHANMQHLVKVDAAWLSPPLDNNQIGERSEASSPIIKTLLIFSHDRDDDCVLAAASGLAGVSFDGENATILGQVHGLMTTIVSLAYTIYQLRF